MMAVYAYDGGDDMMKTFSAVIDVNAFFLNVVYTNYLIAVLTTVYESMQEKGEFDFSAIKY
jgi:hypothetical protein